MYTCRQNNYTPTECVYARVYRILRLVHKVLVYIKKVPNHVTKLQLVNISIDNSIIPIQFSCVHFDNIMTKRNMTASVS